MFCLQMQAFWQGRKKKAQFIHRQYKTWKCFEAKKERKKRKEERKKKKRRSCMKES